MEYPARQTVVWPEFSSTASNRTLDVPYEFKKRNAMGSGAKSVKAAKAKKRQSPSGGSCSF